VANIPRDSLRLAIPKALLALLADAEERLPLEAPSSKRIALRDARALLYRAFPTLQINEVELAQQLAEEDGEPIEDTI